MRECYHCHGAWLGLMRTPVLSHCVEHVSCVSLHQCPRKWRALEKGLCLSSFCWLTQKTQRQAIRILFPWTPITLGERLYLVIFYLVSRVDFSLLQQDREMGPHHRLPTNAADSEMLEKPRKTKTTLLCYSHQPCLTLRFNMRNSLIAEKEILDSF